MERHDEQFGGTRGGKLGCLAATVIGLPLGGVLWFFSFYGTCGEGDPCHDGEGARALLVIGIALLVATAVGLTVRIIVNRALRREKASEKANR